MTDITFRPLSYADLPLMHHWLNEGEAFTWYGRKPTTLEEITAEYTPTIEHTEPVSGFVILIDTQPAGYIQWYLTHDHPDYARQVSVPLDSAGVDLFIGDDQYLHRGLGPAIMREFLRDVVFTDPRVGRCIVDPDERNTIAIRAYEKAGFHHLKTIQIIDEPAPSYFMELTRESFQVSGVRR